MEIIIHRGTKEIGGTCIELKTRKTSLLLDLGLPLSKASRVINLSTLNPDAVVISHPHQDHFGLIDALKDEVPVYIGEVAKRLIEATKVFLDQEPHTNAFVFIRRDEPFRVGDFTITPYLVDHSAVDAYAFLVEAEGKRLFYSGDFRAHGRKSVLFDRMIKHPPPDIDVLFMEGTMMKRGNTDYPDEKAVERKIIDVLRDQENISFLICSSQNIDRIVSACRACRRTNKILVIDLYTAWVLEQLKRISDNVPSLEWEYIRMYADRSHDGRLKANPDYFDNFRKRAYKHRIKKEELAANPANFLYISKVSKFKVMNLYKGLNGKPVNVIYSQWLGYLEYSNEDYWGAEEIAEYRSDPQVNFIYAHTSGHATLDQLKRFACAMNPSILIPVHTEHKGCYRDYFTNVVELNDGERYKV